MSLLEFIKRHWVVYLIAAVIAVVCGLGASYVVGQIGSTPESLRAARTPDEETTTTVADADGMNSLDGDAPEGTAAADANAENAG